MYAKYNRKRAAAQIRRLAASKAVPDDYDRDAYAKVTRNNKARIGVLPEFKQQDKNTTKYIGSWRYCMPCNKAGMHERNYKLHS